MKDTEERLTTLEDVVRELVRAVESFRRSLSKDLVPFGPFKYQEADLPRDEDAQLELIEILNAVYERGLVRITWDETGPSFTAAKWLNFLAGDNYTWLDERDHSARLLVTDQDSLFTIQLDHQSRQRPEDKDWAPHPTKVHELKG